MRDMGFDCIFPVMGYHFTFQCTSKYSCFNKLVGRLFWIERSFETVFQSIFAVSQRLRKRREKKCPNNPHLLQAQRPFPYCYLNQQDALAMKFNPAPSYHQTHPFSIRFFWFQQDFFSSMSFEFDILTKQKRTQGNTTLLKPFFPSLWETAARYRLLSQRAFKPKTTNQQHFSGKKKWT